MLLLLLLLLFVMMTIKEPEKRKSEKEPEKRKLIDKWIKDYDDSVLQNKMDKDSILYCEGAHKPLCRGYLHWIPLIAFFVAFFLFYEKCDTLIKQILFIFWIIINIIICKTSIILHTYNLNPIQEIQIQKMDHIMIYLNIINHLVQYIFLVNYKDLSLKYSYFIFFMSVTISLYGIYLVINCKKKGYHLFFSTISLWMIIPLVIKHFSTNQIIYFAGIWVFTILGLIIYNIEKPISDIFGYHEIFHFFTVVSAIFSIFLEKNLLEH